MKIYTVILTSASFASVIHTGRFPMRRIENILESLVCSDPMTPNAYEIAFLNF